MALHHLLRSPANTLSHAPGEIPDPGQQTVLGLGLANVLRIVGGCALTSLRFEVRGVCRGVAEVAHRLRGAQPVPPVARSIDRGRGGGLMKCRGLWQGQEAAAALAMCQWGGGAPKGVIGAQGGGGGGWRRGPNRFRRCTSGAVPMAVGPALSRGLSPPQCWAMGCVSRRYSAIQTGMGSSPNAAQNGRAL